MGFNRPVYVAILGDDPEGLARVAPAFADKVRQVPGIVDVETSVKQGMPAYAVRLKEGAVRELGLTAPHLAANLRAYVNGEVATHWTTPDGNQVEVLLRLNRQQRQRVDQLLHLPVSFARDGTPVTLGSVAEITEVFNPEIIRRQNLQRREAVYAGVKGRSVGEVGADVQKLVKETSLPPGFSFDVGGQLQQQDEAFTGLLAAMGLAVVFIDIVLASQFGSFVQPLAIMASLPLALALNDGGEIQAPMGHAIIGGVLTSSLLTLVVVPVLYSYLVRPLAGRRQPAPESTDSPSGGDELGTLARP